ncbi:MAG: hypothetical protein LR015_09905 [Verrucomicrobia bacterium]|nr:hypothetical protein [Verrucomicrobiota bacterium]
MARRLYTEKDVLELFAKGGSASDIPADALLTPSARDRLQMRPGQNGSGFADQKKGSVKSPVSGTPVAPILPDYVYKWAPGGDPKTPAEIQAFFTSPEIEQLKQRMCDMGRRMWEREFTDGNGGNMVIRVGGQFIPYDSDPDFQGFYDT